MDYRLDGLGLIPDNALAALSLGVKQQGHEVNHSPPTSVELKEGGAIPPQCPTS
jgi:hypothetical protein